MWFANNVIYCGKIGLGEEFMIVCLPFIQDVLIKLERKVNFVSIKIYENKEQNCASFGACT